MGDELSKAFDFQWETREGKTIMAGDTAVTPRSQALLIKSPFGGLVWNRPHSILVARGEQTDEIAIEDPTRQGIWGIMGLGAALTAVGVLYILLTRPK